MQRSHPGMVFVRMVLGAIVGIVGALALLWYGWQIDPVGWREALGLPAASVAQGEGASDPAGAAGTGDEGAMGREGAGSGTAAETGAGDSPKGVPPGNGAGGKGGSGGESGAGAGGPAPGTAGGSGAGAKVDEPPAQPPRGTPRRSLPNAEAQAAARMTLDQLYHLDQVRTRSDKLQLVKKLIAAAGEPTASDAEQFVLLSQAARLAAEAGQAAPVESALEQLRQRFEWDEVTTRDKLLLRTLEHVHDEASMDELVHATQRLIAALVQRNRVADAVKWADKVHAACFKDFGKRHRKFVFDGQTALKKLQQKWQASEEAREALERGEGTPSQHLTYGLFTCGLRGEWDLGLPHIELGSDPGLRAVAGLDLTRPTDPLARLALADAWYEQVRSHAAYEALAARAVYWYELVEDHVTGLNKTKVTDRLVELREQLQALDDREYSAAGLARRAAPK